MTKSHIDPPIVGDRIERRAADRKRRTSRWFLLAPVVLVAAGVVLILFLGGGGDGGLLDPGGGDEPSDETPAFDFRLTKTSVVATLPEADFEALERAAVPATESVAEVVDQLYTTAFLDPTTWRDGDYESIFPLFTDDAAATARTNLETLTLGAEAGDVFETVRPQRGSIRFNVLFDPESAPDTVVADVRFFALGERRDGTFVTIVSEGSLFLRNLHGWRITAFDLERRDRETAGPAATGSTGGTGATGDAAG
ncbi:MAG TPA: hypothetical protein VLA90_03490 [Actinomycetota bacterium]|nr:hypothetical protein [Actinomycetota bacterium]